jgi:hypothetical protein
MRLGNMLQLLQISLLLALILNSSIKIAILTAILMLFLFCVFITVNLLTKRKPMTKQALLPLPKRDNQQLLPAKYKPIRARVPPSLSPKKRKYAVPNNIIPKLQQRLSFLRNMIITQQSIGNIDTATYFRSIAAECEKLILDVSAFLIEKPEATEAEVKKFLLQHV